MSVRTASRRCSCTSCGTGSMADCSTSGSEIQGTTPMMIPRLMPLAATLWMLAVWLSTPRAAQVTAETAEGGVRRTGHLDVSLFAHSEECMACHNNLITPGGEDVSIGATWRSTMMANSARDPYWQAGVRRETIDHPTHAAAIQDECGGCHMPMATRIAREAGGTGEVFSHLPLTTRSGSEMRRLAADGVSCSVCHQISSEHLGTRESFNG